jgi:protein-histidine pros-kinase
VKLDEQKVKQILYNLLSNAVKFTNPGGQAEVNVEPIPGDRIRLDVTDTGIGIKPEDFPKLFHEFVQLDSGAARHYEGTGLGLALTRKLVELHGGEISFASEVGRGSRFSVVLPRSCHSSIED